MNLHILQGLFFEISNIGSLSVHKNRRKHQTPDGLTSLISPKYISRIHPVHHIIQTSIIPVRNNRLRQLLELRQIAQLLNRHIFRTSLTILNHARPDCTESTTPCNQGGFSIHQHPLLVYLKSLAYTF